MTLGAFVNPGSWAARTWRRATGALALLLAPSLLAAAGHDPSAAAAFPPALESYGDAHLTSLAEVLRHRLAVQPFNLWASLLFVAAIVHTFFTHKFRHWSHLLEERHRRRLKAAGATAEEVAAAPPSVAARMLHFFSEVEAVFGLWVIPLFVLLAAEFGRDTANHYLTNRVNYQEPMFVVVIMAMSATRPVLHIAERCLRFFAGFGGGRPAAWWLSILTVGPLLGSFITEPAAMTISASLLARQFFERRPRLPFAYATLGLLFVNISVGGTLTHFAAPPVLMVAAPWKWDTDYMFLHFGWVAAVGIVISNLLYFLVFRKDFGRLQAAPPVAAASANGAATGRPIPAWVTVAHLVFMAGAVLHAHYPPLLVGWFLIFLAFFEVTEEYQSRLELRSPILVGFFLAGLVIHGGLQQWWIAPLLSRLGELPLMFGAIGLTAFNDNAAITYLATLGPELAESAKYAIVAGAVTGGGLTVIANAPNPAGQAILGRYFPLGIAPFGLLLGALAPTVIMALCFLLLH